MTNETMEYLVGKHPVCHCFEEQYLWCLFLYCTQRLSNAVIVPALCVPALFRLSDFPGADHPLTFQGWVMWFFFFFFCLCVWLPLRLPALCYISIVPTSSIVLYSYRPPSHPGQEPCLILCLADHKNAVGTPLFWKETGWISSSLLCVLT